MAREIVQVDPDQPQITLNERHMGDRAGLAEVTLWIEILRTKYGYNVIYGPFDGWPKRGIRNSHWCRAQDIVSQKLFN